MPPPQYMKLIPSTVRYITVIHLTSDFGVYDLILSKIESRHEQGMGKLSSSYGAVPVSLCTHCIVATFQLFDD